MNRLLRGRAAAAVSAGVVAALAAGGGYALASGTGTITVCVSHSNGALYKAKKCKKHDKKLTWNQTGQQGPRGLQGIQGVPGPPGAALSSSGNVKMTAQATPTPVTLLTFGPVTYTATCKDNGAGSVTLDIDAQSSESGAYLVSSVGNLAMTSSPTLIWFFTSTGSAMQSERQQVIEPANDGHLADVLFGIHTFGADCVARVDAQAS